MFEVYLLANFSWIVEVDFQELVFFSMVAVKGTARTGHSHNHDFAFWSGDEVPSGRELWALHFEMIVEMLFGRFVGAFVQNTANGVSSLPFP